MDKVVGASQPQNAQEISDQKLSQPSGLLEVYTGKSNNKRKNHVLSTGSTSSVRSPSSSKVSLRNIKGAAVSNSSSGLNRESLVSKSTVGRGDCAFHAAFG